MEGKHKAVTALLARGASTSVVDEVSQFTLLQFLVYMYKYTNLLVLHIYHILLSYNIGFEISVVLVQNPALNKEFYNHIWSQESFKILEFLHPAHVGIKGEMLGPEVVNQL